MLFYAAALQTLNYDWDTLQILGGGGENSAGFRDGLGHLFFREPLGAMAPLFNYTLCKHWNFPLS